MLRIAPLLLPAVLALALPARAQDAPVLDAPPIEVVDRAARPDDARPDDAPPSAFATRVPLERARDEGRSVAEVLEALPGLHVRRFGGLGAYSTLSIRGSSASQVQVLVDGVPVVPSSDRASSLGDLSVDAFESVDVYRGVAPLALGGFAIGGVVDLRSAAVPRARALAMAGSFGTYRLAVAAPVPIGPVRVAARASLFGSEGDFEFLDDRGTRQNVDDDRRVVRRNNRFRLLDAGARAAGRLGRARLSGTAALSARDAGVPGLGIFQARRAQARALRAIGSIEVVHPVAGAGSATLRLAGRADRTAFVDRGNEVGLGAQDRRDATGYAQLSAPVRLGWGASLVELVPHAAVERYEADDPLALEAPPTGIVRRSAGLGAGVERGLGPVTARLAGALVAVSDGFEPVRAAAGSIPRAARSALRLEPGAAAGARVELARGLHAQANGSYAVRSPTFEELFGSSGAVQGSADLSPERALGADVGATLALGWLQITAAGYWQEVTDLVQFVLTSQRTSRARNLGRARLRGLELGARARLTPWLGATLAVDWLDARNRSDVPSQRGKRVPGRPELDASGAVDVRVGPVRLGADADLVAGNHLDAANLQQVPARVYLGASARWSVAAGVSLALTVRNLLDHVVADVPLRPRPVGGAPTAPTAVSDYGGFPLPGRAAFVTLRWSEEEEEEDRR